MDRPIRADNESMGRIAVVVACVVAVLALPQVALGAPTLVAHSCGSSCGSLDATGKGTLNINGNGAEWGSIASGTVKVQDKSHNGHRDWSLTNCDKRFKDPKDETITVCQADNTIYSGGGRLRGEPLERLHRGFGEVDRSATRACDAQPACASTE